MCSLPIVCLHVLRQQGGVMEHPAAVLTPQGRGVVLYLELETKVYMKVSDQGEGPY